MRLAFIIFFISVFCVTAHSRHIVGGEMTYVCLGEGSTPGSWNYEFTMRVYRDCFSGGAEYDPFARIGMYTVDDQGEREYFTQFNIPLGAVTTIDPSDENPCLIIPPDICVEEGVYTWVVEDIERIDRDYRLEYRRCCRNESISNIINPGGSGATFGITLTDEAIGLCNSSPTFNSFPPIVICVDEDIDFRHTATDADGDLLVYSFCSPLLGGGDEGSFLNPGDPTSCEGLDPDPFDCVDAYGPVEFVVPTYTPAAPMAGNPVVNIDPISALISGVPEIQGQFVVGVCVTEFRNGIELSQVQRDFQFNVTFCEPTVNASIVADSITSGEEFIINNCGSRTVDFVNLSENVAFINDYYWRFEANGDTVEFDTRDLTYEFPSPGRYTGIMAINRGTVCADTALLEVNIYPGLEADFDFDYDTCVAEEVFFEDLSLTEGQNIVSWNWAFGDDSTSTEQNPEHFYSTPGLKEVQLQIRDENGCTDDLTRSISYFPAPAIVILDPSKFVGCAPGFIQFDNLSSPIDSTYDILWDFGDGESSTELSPRHFYDSVGVFSIRVDITSPIGCMVSGFFPDYIEILPGPKAGFIFTPPSELISAINPTVSFIDQSMDAISWQWLFGDSGSSFEPNPTYTFPDTGRIEVLQVVRHQSSCTDTARVTIDVNPVVNYFLPNAFSPNNDGVNDVFVGVGAQEGFRSFRMLVINRWGEIIYETNDPSQGWNGLKFNTGRPSPQGLYAVQVEYVGPRGDVTKLEGPLTLLR